MKWSKLFIPTLREDPAKAVSEAHRLLMRAGYIRLFSGGNYSCLFAARRTLFKIEAIIRREMDAMGGQEMLLAEVEPVVAPVDAIARELRSHREYPQIWYQLRNWGSPNGIAQDSFSLDSSAEGLDESYEKHSQAYRRILERCGVPHVAAGNDLMMPSEAGEDFLVRGTGYAANLEVATGVASPPAAPDPEGDLAPEEFHTPNVKTIAELAAFTGVPETSLIKSLVFSLPGAPVMVLVRGDHHVSETKLSQAMGSLCTAADPELVKKWLGAEIGSLGPVGVANMPIVVDEALRGRRNMIAGANKNDHHLRHVTPGKDFEARFADIRQFEPADLSPVDGTPLTIDKAIKLGSLQKLGNEKNSSWMGHYRLWIERILIAAAVANRDADGLMLPAAIAPFDVAITPVDFEVESLRKAAEEIYGAVKEAGFDVVLDDRSLRAGVKFKDADLIGLPWRVVVGKKVADGLVEVVERRTKQRTDVAAGEVVGFVKTRLER